MKALPWMLATVLARGMGLLGGGQLVQTVLPAQAAQAGQAAASQRPGTNAGITPTLDARIAELALPPPTAQALQAAMRSGNTVGAERLLLPAIDEHDHTPHTARLLTFLGGVYFTAGDMAQAAVAWKKSDALLPLPAPARFSLAMAFVRLGRGEWAAQELTKLVHESPATALYPYWLGRIDYDAHRYAEAVVQFQAAIARDNSMARAHDNLGLCFFYLNRNAEAEAEFRRAIAIDGDRSRTAGWPHLNLAIELEFTNRLSDAAAELRRALALDPGLAPAQFELGNVLEHQGLRSEAALAFAEAARLDRSYPEPHYALARLLRRAGDNAGSRREVDLYKQLQLAKTKGAPAPPDTP